MSREAKSQQHSRDLQASVRADLGDAGGAIDDDLVLFEIARRALGGPNDDGRASYQVAVTRCDACQQMGIDAGGESFPVDEATAQKIACDSQELGEVDGDVDSNVDSDVEGDDGIPHVGVGSPPRPRRRATQTVPPALRRQVIRRDNKHCKVDGCRNHRYLDVHHLDPRSEGGSHDPERLAVMCSAHHAAVHAGALCIDGSASSGFVFRHADGSRYGESPRGPAVELAQHAFGALTELGFKQTRARALVDAVQRGSAPSELGEFIRAALLLT